MKKQSSNSKKKMQQAISDYDATDTTDMIDSSKPLKFEEVVGKRQGKRLCRPAQGKLEERESF
jgi:hypothetical protein